MGAKLYTQAWQLDISRPEREILLALCDHADDTGENCYPRPEYLQWKTGYSEQQIRRLVRLLEQKRIIETVSKGNGRGNYSQYIIRLEKGIKKLGFQDWLEQKRQAERVLKTGAKGSQNEALPETKGLHSEPVKGITTVEKGNIPDVKATKAEQKDTRYKEEPHETVLETKEEPVSRMRDRVKEVFEYWQVVMGKQKSTLTPERQKKIEDRLYSRSVDEVKLAIDGCRGSPHNMGQNDRNTEFNDIELICRNETKLEQFIERAGKPKVGNGVKSNGNGQYKTKTEQRDDQIDALAEHFASRNRGIDNH